MQEGFGRSTQIKLPGNLLLDTRLITANSNAHHNNNRLSASGSISNHPVPGMVDRLHPDYSSLSEEFLATSQSGKTLAQTLMQSAIQTSRSRPTSATGTKSGPTNSDQSSNQSPLPSPMFKSKRTSSGEWEDSPISFWTYRGISVHFGHKYHGWNHLGETNRSKEGNSDDKELLINLVFYLCFM